MNKESVVSARALLTSSCSHRLIMCLCAGQNIIIWPHDIILFPPNINNSDLRGQKPMSSDLCDLYSVSDVDKHIAVNKRYYYRYHSETVSRSKLNILKVYCISILWNTINIQYTVELLGAKASVILRDLSAHSSRHPIIPTNPEAEAVMLLKGWLGS